MSPKYKWNVFFISKSYINNYGSLRGLRAKLQNYVRLNPVFVLHPYFLHSTELERNKSNPSFKNLLVEDKGEIFQFLFSCKCFLVPQLAKTERILTLFNPSLSRNQHCNTNYIELLDLKCLDLN